MNMTENTTPPKSFPLNENSDYTKIDWSQNTRFPPITQIDNEKKPAQELQLSSNIFTQNTPITEPNYQYKRPISDTTASQKSRSSPISPISYITRFKPEKKKSKNNSRSNPFSHRD